MPKRAFQEYRARSFANTEQKMKVKICSQMASFFFLSLQLLRIAISVIIVGFVNVPVTNLRM